MEEEQPTPAPNEPQKVAPKGVNKLLVPLILAIIVIIGGASYFFGVSQRNKTVLGTYSTPSATPEVTSSGSPEASAVATVTPEASVTPTPEASASPTSTPTPTPTGTPNMKLVNPNLFKQLAVIFQVTGVNLSVDAAQKSIFLCLGNVTFNFTGTITSNGAGTANYRWERSDGVLSPSTSITFAAAENKTVTTNWSVPCGNYWMKLHVTSPNDSYSPQISFKAAF